MTINEYIDKWRLEQNRLIDAASYATTQFERAAHDGAAEKIKAMLDELEAINPTPAK